MKLIFVASAKTGHNFVMNQVRSWFGIKWTYGDNLVNIENVPPNMAAKHIKIRKKDYSHIIMVNRDLLNWWASCLKWVVRDFDRVEDQKYILGEYFKCWGENSKEFFGETNFLGNKLLVMYDQFNHNHIYRKALCQALGGEYSEALRNMVPEAGRGSSFDHQKYDGKGSEMRTHLRYQQIMGTPWEELYLEFLRKYTYIIELYEEYSDWFGITPEKQKILNML